MGPQLEITGQRADGQEFPIESTISKTLIAGKLQMTAVLRDVTEHRQAEMIGEIEESNRNASTDVAMFLKALAFELRGLEAASRNAVGTSIINVEQHVERLMKLHPFPLLLRFTDRHLRPATLLRQLRAQHTDHHVLGSFMVKETSTPVAGECHEMGVALSIKGAFGDHKLRLGDATARLNPHVASRPGE